MRSSSALLAAALVALTRSASAQGHSAEELFNEGRAALERGDYDAACPKLAESLRLSGEGGPRLSLAECEERRGHLVVALEMYQEAARVLPSGSVQGKTAADRAAGLERKVPTLTLDVDSRAPADVRLEVDGKPLASRTSRADPGDHVVTVSAPGCAAAKVSVRLEVGDRRHLPVSPGPCGGASGYAGSTSSRRTAGFVVGGIGVAGVLVFGVTGALALGKQGTVDDHCHDHGCDPTGLAAARAGKTLDVVNAITLGVGALGLGVGAVLVATAPKSSAPAVGISVSPSATGVSIGLSTPLTF